MMTIMNHSANGRRVLVTLLLSLVCHAAFVYTHESVPVTMPARERRDSYGGGYGGGGYGSSYSGGGYGCSCPQPQCDTKTDALLAFGIGALVGLLLAMLRGGMMMMMAAAAGAPMQMGRSAAAVEDPLHNVTWHMQGAEEDLDGDAAARRSFNSYGRRSSLVQLLHLPDKFGEDLAPVITDLLEMYTKSNKKPECLRRWFCEFTHHLYKRGGLQARLGSLSSIAFGWYTKDLVPVLQNILPGTKDVDCKLLSPKCDKSFHTEE